MKKRILTFLIIILSVAIQLFAAQAVIPNAPEYEETLTINADPETATVIADAPIEDIVVNLYYNNSPLLEGSTISQDSNNESLILDESWILTPFSIILDGSDIVEYSLNVEIEVGYFQLLDEFGNVAQGSEGYTIDTQAMELVNTTNDETIAFENFPIGSNSYKYTIPIQTEYYFSEESVVSFQLTWQEKSIVQPGDYISNIQVTFYTD